MRTVARKVMEVQQTGGSTNVRDGWISLRIAGAAARTMLVQAAATRWGVAPNLVMTNEGVLTERGGRRRHYAEFLEDAARLKPPADPKLKSPAQFRLVGTHVARVDTAAKVAGAATFGIDVRVPGMVHAAIRHVPSFGGKVSTFDAIALAKHPGVIKVVALPSGVAVIADTHWHARSALDLGELLGQFRFDASAAASLDSNAVREAMLRDVATGDGKSIADIGDAEKAPRSANRPVSAEYSVPLLAHATMEPMNATARLADGRLEVWTGTQAPDVVRDVAASAAGVSKQRTTVHTLYLGGGFGRRVETDVAAEAAALARQLPGRAVQLLWTREEDMQHDWYRPAAVAQMQAGLDDQRRPIAWRGRVASAPALGPFLSRILGLPLGTLPDKAEVDETIRPRYRIPNLAVEWIPSVSVVPIGLWRSVSNSYGAFFTESFIDEIAVDAGADPYLFHRGLLDDIPRHRRVLELAAEKSGWGRALEPGLGRGIAMHESFGSIVAQVAEVRALASGQVRIECIVAVVDCGLPVNPAGIVAQMESAIVYGLTAAMYGETTLRAGAGAGAQSNFHDYEMVRMPTMPRIEIHIAPPGGPLGGIGEVGTPPVAPAVANAIFAATGKRVRTLPFRKAGVV